LQFLKKKFSSFKFFFEYLVIETLDPERDPDPHPDPELEKFWIRTRIRINSMRIRNPALRLGLERKLRWQRVQP
jgi:hypothetical protein